MRIALFFSYSTSLQDWLKAGFISRELKPFYDLSILYGYKIYLITYGDESDFQLEEAYLKKYNIEVKPLKVKQGRKFFRNLYDIFSILKNIDLFVSIQTTALIAALPVSYLLNKPLISRSGYDVFAFSRHSQYSLKRLVLRALELFASLTASAFIFATQNDLDTFLLRTKYLRLLKKKFFSKDVLTYILPNWVDTKLFAPLLDDIKPQLETRKINFFSIGRLEDQKNYLSLISLLASSSYKTSLTIAGTGSEFSAIKNLSHKLRYDVTLLGRVDHSLLPGLINKHDIYIQNSLIEGNPKSVLEAMSCGAIVVCRDCPGIGQLIESKLNGYLYNSDNFYDIINTIISNKNLNLIRSNARTFIINKYNYSLYIKSLNVILESSIY